MLLSVVVLQYVPQRCGACVIPEKKIDRHFSKS